MSKIAVGFGAALVSAALKVLLDNNIAALVTLLIGFVMIAWGVIDEIGERKSASVSLTAPVPEHVFPERRPKVVPDHYGLPLDGRVREALHVVNDGEPAYDVRIEPIELGGGWTLHFDDALSRLEGANCFLAVVSHGNEHNTSLDSVWRSLKEAAEIPAMFPLIIKYRDFNNQWYRSVCELRRDVEKSWPGFAVKFVRQDFA